MRDVPDEWGHDPQVQYLRKIFAAIEKAQKNLLQKCDVSPFDERLRRIREATLSAFEKAWVIASRRGRATTEDDILYLYLSVFARILRGNRIAVPDSLLPVNKELASIVQEVFS